MDATEKKFDALRKGFQTEEDQIRISKWEKDLRVHTLTSNLKENDAFKMLIARYQAERERLRATLSKDDKLFKDADGLLLGRMIHARISFINEFLKVFDVAEAAAKTLMSTIDKALTE